MEETAPSRMLPTSWHRFRLRRPRKLLSWGWHRRGDLIRAACHGASDSGVSQTRGWKTSRLREIPWDWELKAPYIGALQWLPFQRPETINQVLARGAQIDWCDERGNTALMHAAAQGHCQNIKTLLDLEADPGLRNANGHSALDLAG